VPNFFNIKLENSGTVQTGFCYPIKNFKEDLIIILYKKIETYKKIELLRIQNFTLFTYGSKLHF